MDDPIRGIEAASKRMRTLDKTADMAEWVQLVLLLSREATIIAPEASPSEEQLIQALEKAQSAGMDDVKILLQYQVAELNRQRKAADPAALNGTFKELIEEAKLKGLYYTEGLLHSSRGFALFYAGRYAESLQAARDALRAIDRTPKPDDLDRVTLKNDLASALDYLGDYKQSRALYEEILTTLGVTNFRYTRGVVAYNYAATLKDESDWPLAQKLYLIAIEQMGQLHEKIINALAKKGLAEIYVRQGRLDEAQNMLDQTMAILESSNMLPDAVADAWRLRAKIFVQKKAWDKAREALKNAQIDQLADNRKYQSDISLLRSQTLEGDGKLGAALDEARKGAELLQQQLRADRTGEIAKLSAQLGIELLEKENEIQAQKLREGEILRKAFSIVSALGLIIMLLLLAAVIMLRQISRSRRHMKQILDTIDEGLIMIDSNLRCSTDLSPFMEQFLGISQDRLKNLDVLELLFERSNLSVDQRSLVRTVLQASLGEDALAWDLNHEHLPQELVLDQGQRCLALHWQTVVGRSRVVRKVLLAFRDVTDRKRLQIHVQEAERRAGRLEVLSQELWQTNINRVKHFVQSVAEIKLHPEDQRMLHTWKGNARTLGLPSLANAIHQVESDPDNWDEFREWVQAYTSLLERIGSIGKESAARLSLWTLLEDASHDLQTLLERNRLRFGSLVCRDEVGDWDQSTLQEVKTILIHAMSNAVDHGFVRPNHQGQKTPESVRIEICAALANGMLTFEIADNGIGLNTAKLEQLAHERGFRPGPGQSVYDVLFLDGVTTTVDVSHTSGRGLGLSAIRATVNSKGGTCHILPASLAGGTRLAISLPRGTMSAEAC